MREGGRPQTGARGPLASSAECRGRSSERHCVWDNVAPVTDGRRELTPKVVWSMSARPPADVDGSAM